MGPKFCAGNFLKIRTAILRNCIIISNRISYNFYFTIIDNVILTSCWSILLCNFSAKQAKPYIYSIFLVAINSHTAWFSKPSIKISIYNIVIYKKLIYICRMISNDLLKGTLRTIVLKLLADNGRMYGYEMTKKVEELSANKIKLTFGALYPVLHKLEADGHVKIEVEYIGKRVRKYYSLTETGRSWTEQKVDEFFDFVNTLSHVLNPLPA